MADDDEKSFRDFIYSNLTVGPSIVEEKKRKQQIIIATEEEAERLTTPAAMKKWAVAFTDPDYAASHSESYEVNEFVGDKFLGACFADYIDEFVRKNPKYKESITPDVLTKLTARWLQKKSLAKFAMSLGFGIHIKKVGKVYDPISLHEDVFEAFFGSLFFLGKHVLGSKGRAFEICDQYLAAVMELPIVDGKTPRESLIFNPTELKDAVTSLKELYSAADWGEVVYQDISDPTSAIKFTFVVKDADNQDLAIGKSNILAQDAKEKAAKEALEILKSRGIDRSSISNYRRKDPEVENLIEEAKNYISKLDGDYSDITLKKIPPITGAIHHFGVFAIQNSSEQDNRIEVMLSKGQGRLPKLAQEQALLKLLGRKQVEKPSQRGRGRGRGRGQEGSFRGRGRGQEGEQESSFRGRGGYRGRGRGQEGEEKEGSFRGGAFGRAELRGGYRGRDRGQEGEQETSFRGRGGYRGRGRGQEGEEKETSFRGGYRGRGQGGYRGRGRGGFVPREE